MHPFILQNMALLTTLYDASDRHYHNLTHIKGMNAEMERVRNYSEFQLIADYEWACLQLAIWFHDAIYDAQTQQVDAGYSERASKDLFLLLADWGEVAEPRSLVAELIGATAHHLDDFTKPVPGFRFTETGGLENHTQLIYLMLDLDLSSLGYDYDTFWTNTNNVRKEYFNTSASNHAAVVAGNGKFLSALLDKPTIFYTEYFRSTYEKKARENIARLLADDRAEM